MKLAIISGGYPTPQYQFFTFVQQLVEQMINMGIEISVIVPQSVDHNIRWREPMLPFENTYCTNKGIEYKVYRPKFFSFADREGVLGRISKFTKRRAIVNVLNKLNYDALYIHFWQNSLLVQDFCKKNKKPLFIACGEGDNALETMVDKLSGEDKKQLKENVTGVISVSSENKRKCLSYGLSTDENTIVLPNCVNTDIFKPSNDKSFRAKLGAKEEDFVISFVGAFIDRKGSKRLSDAISKIGDKSIKSIFIGKPLGSDIEEPTCDGILFKGEVVHDNIPEYLNSSDLFVLPTRKEGCCNAIVEALSCGLPVISSDAPFNDDILNENNSIRVNSDDVDAIADAIVQMKKNRGLKATLSQIVGKNNPYSLETRAKKIITFIQERI